MEDDSYEECFNAAYAAVAVVSSFLRKKRQRSVAQWAAAALALLEADGLRSEDDDREERLKRSRWVYLRPNYEDSAWGIMLREGELHDLCSKCGRAFRRRFRVPYPVFEPSVELIKERRWFPSSSKEVAGRQRIPIELKEGHYTEPKGQACTVSVVLAGNHSADTGVADPRARCLLDYISQLSLISETTVHGIFHTFCVRFARELYREYINLPTGDDRRNVMGDYHKLGVSGAIGSTDVTHVKWDRCLYSLQRFYTSKEGFPTIAYQATVDFTGRRLGTTRGFAGAQNDRTIIRCDFAVQKVREDRPYTKQIFEYKRADGMAVQHKGNYLITDNGYHKWRIRIYPTKSPRDMGDIS